MINPKQTEELLALVEMCEGRWEEYFRLVVKWQTQYEQELKQQGEEYEKH